MELPVFSNEQDVIICSTSCEELSPSGPAGLISKAVYHVPPTIGHAAVFVYAILRVYLTDIMFTAY